MQSLFFFQQIAHSIKSMIRLAGDKQPVTKIIHQPRWNLGGALFHEIARIRHGEMCPTIWGKIMLARLQVRTKLRIP